MNALGMIEVQSIPLGVNAGDAMLKAATVQLVTAQPVCRVLGPTTTRSG